MRKKVQKKIDFFKLPNCFQANETQILKEYNLFQEHKPLVLELGCGKASFSIELAQKNPNYNYIAIDTKINRLSDGAKLAISKNITNIFFVQMHIEQIMLHFDNYSIDKIWITFPDPFPKDRHEKHRLTNLKFLNYYHHLLKPKGQLLFKTDNQQLFDYTLQILKSIHWYPTEITYNLYASSYLNEENSIPTEYEIKFLNQGKKICYLKLINCDEIFQNIPIEPVPVFSPLKRWQPDEKIFEWEILKPYQNLIHELSFEEYDLNMQFARTNDFEKFIWVLIKGEVRIEMVQNNVSQYFKFNQPGQVIQFTPNENKLYGITIQRTLLVKIPRNL